jgi:two-component system NtrC family sensor kinase
MNSFVNSAQAIDNERIIRVKIYSGSDSTHAKAPDTGNGISAGVELGSRLRPSICYQIVRDHHGETTVESEIGKGTTFTIILTIWLKNKKE